MTPPAGPEEVRVRVREWRMDALHDLYGLDHSNEIIGRVDAMNEHNVLARAYAALQARGAPREPTGEMWAAGRRVFGDEAEKYRTAESTIMADAHADRSPEKIWQAMWDAWHSRLAKLEQERGREP